MPSVDELLNAAEVAEATLTETNDVIEIDADTRTMIIPDTERIFGVMSDEKGERKYFRCKRFVGNGIDLSKLDLRVIYQNASGLESGRDKYIVTDLATDGEDYVTFSWELSRKITAYKGIISFIVCAIKTGTDGIITNEWNTTLANGVVLDGLEVSGTQEQEKEAYDYYKQLEAELEKKAQEVIGTIPSDYTQTLKDVSNLKGEVTDGRTDVDGEVHKNIGDAMRGQARKLRENLVVRQKEQPTDPNNNVWISDEDDEVEVPDMGEFNSLKEDIVATSNELYKKEEGEIAVDSSDYNLLENKVAYIDTNNEIMTYENANAYVMHKNVISGEKYRILSQTHGSVNTLLYAICDSSGKVINSAKMGVPPNTYITTEIEIPSKGVELYLNEFPTKTYPLVVNKIMIINISKINGKVIVSCWGDSLTLGVGVGSSYSKAFPYVLYGLLDGRKVINCGVGGENTINIASRQGSLPNIVKPFTIPADTNKVEIELTNIYGDSAGILLQGGSALDPITGKYVMTAQINPCSINGVEGTLTYENGKYYFSRSENGESVIVSRPTPLITYAMKSMRDNINIIWIGTNGGFTTSTELIECIEAMIDYISPINKKYIVIGIHHLVSTVTETFEMLEKNMAMHFGRHYINQRKYMIEYGLSDAGITPTVEDTTAISQGKIPPSLLYDGVHYNDKGYNIIANLVAERGKELAYW